MRIAITGRLEKIENKNKIVIFDWGGVIESHKEGEYNIFTSDIDMMKRLNVDVSKIDVIQEYTNCNDDANGISISCQSKKEECEAWFERVKKKFNLQCDLKEFAKVYDEEKDCKIKPSNILFIDDRSDNIETAKNRGWNTCLASGYELDKIEDSLNKFLNI